MGTTATEVTRSHKARAAQLLNRMAESAPGAYACVEQTSCIDGKRSMDAMVLGVAADIARMENREITISGLRAECIAGADDEETIAGWESYADAVYCEVAG